MRTGVLVVAGAVFALVCGCAHETYVVDAKHPEVEYTESGDLKWHGRFIEPAELPKLLDKSGVDRKSQIDIRVPPGIQSLKGPRQLLFLLRRAGYTRGVLVTEKRAYSYSKTAEQRTPVRQSAPTPQEKRRIRYK